MGLKRSVIKYYNDLDLDVEKGLEIPDIIHDKLAVLLLVDSWDGSSGSTSDSYRVVVDAFLHIEENVKALDLDPVSKLNQESGKKKEK